MLALDTDVVVAWTMAGAPAHNAVSRLIKEEVSRPGGMLGLTSQVIFEFLHVVTDPRRFEKALTMEAARLRARALWDARDVERLVPKATLVHRTMELMSLHHLGRKRILDTALAVTLESAGVRRLATLNRRDFEVFEFLELLEPL